MAIESVWARGEADGVWHRTIETYPNAAETSCCGRLVPATRFVAGTAPDLHSAGEIRPRFCPRAGK